MDSGSIKLLRKKLSLAQPEFAQLFDVHPMTVSKWENGRLEPSAYQAELMKAFAQGAENKVVRSTLKNVLIGMGVVAAIILLLKNIKK